MTIVAIHPDSAGVKQAATIVLTSSVRPADRFGPKPYLGNGLLDAFADVLPGDPAKIFGEK